MNQPIEIRDRRKCEWFWCDKNILKSKIYQSTKLVYFALCCYSNEHTQRCFPSVDVIAQIAGVSRRTVIYALSDLNAAKIITVVKATGRHNEYILNSVTSARVARVEVVQLATRNQCNDVAPNQCNDVAPELIKRTKQKNKGWEILEKKMQELGLKVIRQKGEQHGRA